MFAAPFTGVDALYPGNGPTATLHPSNPGPNATPEERRQAEELREQAQQQAVRQVMFMIVMMMLVGGIDKGS
ncbi:hypothetical protein HDU93_000014 [Gonapodya sp. JEL0774]|nr:hypothetical protein HDU93_000014 [Gonapodya sp. JEL0774]